MSANQGTLQLPPQASTVAASVDSLYYFIFYISVFFFLLVVGLGVYFVFKYHRKTVEVEKTPDLSHNMLLETVWTVIPSIILLIIFVWGAVGFMKMSVPPANSMEIKVTGQKWFWSFEHKNGTVAVNELVVPINTPVNLLMSSKDVLHSFFVPAFRIKQDVLPNRYTQVWFEATQAGDFPLLCTEYCGTSHSTMIGVVKVLEEKDYAAWLENAEATSNVPLPELGKTLYKKQACFTCHSLDGGKLVGPTFKGRFGTQIGFADGSKGAVDENYLRESILNPMAKVAAGYQPVMPSYQGLLKDREIDALIAYIKSLNE